MRRRDYEISLTSARRQLKPRDEPYWASLGRGRVVGYRVSRVGPGTWHARWTEPEQAPGCSRQRYLQRSLGCESDLEYRQAVVAAQEYFNECEQEWQRRKSGFSPVRIVTVKDACVEYLNSLRQKKGDEPAHRAQSFFQRAVYGMPIASVPLLVLGKHDVESWRNSLVRAPIEGRRGRSKQAVNRIYRQFAAALSYAKSVGAIASDQAWKSVGKFPVPDRRRETYLTLEQRAALIAECEREKAAEEISENPKELRYCDRDLANLLRGALYIGARPGELAKARVRDLSVREQKITLISAKNKNGEARPRPFFLDEPDAFAFFKQMAEGKCADDFLMTLSSGEPWVNEKGQPKYVRWGRGTRGAIKLANKVLPPESRIPEGTVAYSARHTAITDLVTVNGIDASSVAAMTGTSVQMIGKHYLELVRERLKDKLAKRRSL